MGLALSLHVLTATVWVGGMFFALLCLRPATAQLDPAVRLTLWTGVLQRFLPWVLLAALVLLGTGFRMLGSYAIGGFKNAGLHIHLMLGLGVLMMLMALHVYFAPFRRLRRAVAGSHWTDAGRALRQIRIFIALNLVLGLLVIAIASGGRYIFH